MRKLTTLRLSKQTNIYEYFSSKSNGVLSRLIDVISLFKKNELKNQQRHGEIPVIFAITQTGRGNGGVESITRIIERLQKIKPIIVTQKKLPINDRWYKAGAKVFVWNFSRKKENLKEAWNGKIKLVKLLIKNNKSMYKLAKKTSSSVVHCNDIYSFWFNAFGAKAAGASVVFNVRDTKPLNQPYGWKWKIASSVCDRFLVLSREMCRELAPRIALLESQRSKFDYIYSVVDPADKNPVDPDTQEKIRNRLEIPPNSFVIGYVAAVNPKKAQLSLIEQAGPHLQSSIPEANLYCIGEFKPESEDYSRRCLEAIKKLGLESTIIFPGYTSEISCWYHALDITIITSIREGLARSMIESLACGTPVVSFDVCSSKEILEEGNCGFVVPQGDYSALVDRISELASDEKKRQELGENGFQIARKLFDPESIVKQYEDLCLSLV